MDAQSFAEWQREQDDEAWARYQGELEEIERETAGKDLHPEAVLTGGTTPAHYPGAYPNLSCCGGPVQLVTVER